MGTTAPTTGTLAGLSNDLAEAVSEVGRSVVAIHGRRRIPSSGVVWGPGVVVTANHTLTRDDDISLTLPDGGTGVASWRAAIPRPISRCSAPTPAFRRPSGRRMATSRLVGSFSRWAAPVPR